MRGSNFTALIRERTPSVSIGTGKPKHMQTNFDYHIPFGW